MRSDLFRKTGNAELLLEADGVRHALARQEAPAHARRSLSAAYAALVEALRGSTMRVLRSALLSVMVLLLASCGARSKDDAVRLESVRNQWAGKYTFDINDLYLEMRAVAPGEVPRGDIESAAASFWLASPENHRQSDVVYLNVYGNDGAWQGQLDWEPEARRWHFSREREHY